MAEVQLGATKLTLHFDPNNDVLYCSLGDPKEAIGMEAGDGIIVRLDPETDELVGFTVLDVARHFLGKAATTISIPLHSSSIGAH